MAVIDSLPGISVTVEIDGETATEYDHEVSDNVDGGNRPEETPHVIRYIEAKPNASFAFQLKSSGHRITAENNYGHECPDSRVGIILIIDGKEIPDMRYWYHDSYQGISPSSEPRIVPPDRLIKSYKQARSGSTFKGTFRFGCLDVVENHELSGPDLSKQDQHVEGYGSLEVHLFMMIKRGWKDAKQIVNPDLATSQPQDSNMPQQIDTKVLRGKALDCRATFDWSPSRTSLKRYSMAYVDPQKRPFARFEFRYRLRDGLIKEGIIRQPSLEDQVEEISDKQRQEEQGAADRRVEEESAEEQRTKELFKALEREEERHRHEMASLRSQLPKKLKREDCDSGDGGPLGDIMSARHKRVKRESDSGTLKHEDNGLGGAAMIDLTGDSD